LTALSLSRAGIGSGKRKKRQPGDDTLMGYNYDSELAQMLEFLPDTSMGISDPVQARANFAQMASMLNAELDTSGIVIENRMIAGPAGAPDIPVRIYSPEGLDAAVPGILHIH